MALRKMQNILVWCFISLFLLILVPAIAYADCRGCCSWHGGVVCSGGVTRCRDGQELSETCWSKGCNKCGWAPVVEIRESLCSEEDARPSDIKKDDWSGYKCLDKDEAGDNWELCLSRTDYTNKKGYGCPGQQKCCPTD